MPALHSLRRAPRAVLAGLAAAALVCGGAVAVAPGAAAATPGAVDDNAFYTPPPIPAGAKPGDVLRYRKVNYAPLNPFGARGTGYQVLYATTNVKGAIVATSGLVIVPQRKAAGGPLVAVAHGTTGMGDTCAPSRIYNGTADFTASYNQIFLDDPVSRGWTVAAPDYNGLGTPGTHTYSVNIEQGRATLDAVRAAQRLQQAAVPAGAKVAIMGYSQGGGAAAAAAEYQPRYAPEMNLVGVAAGGVPADMVALGRSLDGGLGFGFLMMAALGYDAAYPELGSRNLLNDKGRAAIGKIDASCVGEAISGYAFGHIADYTTKNPLDVPEIRAKFEENSLGTSAPKVPVFLYHAIADELVPYAQDQALRRTWCSMGVNVKWQDFIGDHVIVAVAGQGDALGYVSDRLAGKAAPNNC